MKSSLNLIQISKSNSQLPAKVLSINNLVIVKATPGIHYELQDATTGKPLEKMVIHRKGKDLIVEVDGQQILILQDYFTDLTLSEAPSFNAGSSLQTSTVLDDGLSLSDAGIVISESNDTSGSVWWKVIGGLAVVGGGIALASGGGGGNDSDSNGNAGLPTMNATLRDIMLTGDSNSNGIRDISGKGNPGSTITVTWPDGTTSSVPVQANGTWVADVPAGMIDGPVTVTITDPTGNPSAPVNAGTLDVTATPPSDILLTGDKNSNGIRDISGKGEPGNTVTVTWPDGRTTSVPVKADGTWEADVPTGMTEGLVTVVATDPAGNTSVPVNAGTLDVSATPPFDIVLTGDRDSNATRDISGKGEPGNTVSVTWPNGSTTSVPVLADGTWVANVPTDMIDGPVTVTATDPAGNISIPVDAGILDVTAAQPLNILFAERAGSNGVYDITGNGEAGSTITITWPDNSATMVVVATDGKWSTEVPASISLDREIIVYSTDPAGNISATETVPLIPNIALNIDSGITGDNITNDSTIIISGLAAGSSWEYSLDDGLTWLTGSGDRITGITGDGEKNISVKETNIDGNSSIENFKFTIDTIVSAPGLTFTDTFTRETNGTVVGTTTDRITNNGFIMVSVDPDVARWEYSIDSGNTWTQGTGTEFGLLQGIYSTGQVQVQQFDKAGNQSNVTVLEGFDLRSDSLITEVGKINLIKYTDTSTGNIYGALDVNNDGVLNSSDLISFTTLQGMFNNGNAITGNEVVTAGVDNERTIVSNGKTLVLANSEEFVFPQGFTAVDASILIANGMEEVVSGGNGFWLANEGTQTGEHQATSVSAMLNNLQPVSFTDDTMNYAFFKVI